MKKANSNTFQTEMDPRIEEQERIRQEKKKNYTHVMRAKLFGVIAINTMEGITSEIDSMLPYELEKGELRLWRCDPVDNIDALSDQYRKYRNGVLYPTSYGDHMDRAIKSLGKDLGIAVSVDLTNTQAIKVDNHWVHSHCIEGADKAHSQHTRGPATGSGGLAVPAERGHHEIGTLRRAHQQVLSSLLQEDGNRD